MTYQQAKEIRSKIHHTDFELNQLADLINEALDSRIGYHPDITLSEDSILVKTVCGNPLCNCHLVSWYLYCPICGYKIERFTGDLE